MGLGLLEIAAVRAIDVALACVRGTAKALLWVGSPSRRAHGGWREWAETKGVRVALLVPFGVAGLGALIVGLGGTGFDGAAALVPAETIAARFPMDWNVEPAPPVPLPPALARASEPPAPPPPQQLAFFSPLPSYGAGTAGADAMAAVPPDAEIARPQLDGPSERIPLPVPAPARRSSGRLNAVLNDAQIASVKQRLRLTADQERMWPAVEAALRSISYSKTAARSASEARVQGKQVASIDPNSSEVQNLKSVAFPLLMSFSEPQKEEVRTLTRLMGLEQIASMF
jgi:hypothetical protein